MTTANEQDAILEYIDNLENRNKRLKDCLAKMLPDYKAEIRRSHILSGKPTSTVDFSRLPIIIEAESMLTSAGWPRFSSQGRAPAPQGGIPKTTTQNHQSNP